MATQPGGDPAAQFSQVWESGYKSLADGMRQAQEFWSNAARSWGELSGAWLGQLSRGAPGVSAETNTILRELQEASFAVGQAWMRLPMVLATGAPPKELQEAITRLTQAQGRAYQLWMDAVTRASRPPTAGAR
jgi:hypothetical protein